MRLHHVIVIIVVSLVGVLVAQRPAYAITARTSTFWGLDWADNPSESGTANGGTWSLGQNNATVINTNTRPENGPLTGNYVQGGGDTVLATITERGSFPFNSTATGRAAITIGAPTPGGLFPYTLALRAETDVGFFGPSPPAKADAAGSDPQFIGIPGLFGGTLSLGPQSQIVETRPDVDQAGASFQITAPGLVTPLASIDLQLVSGNIDAVVNFATSPHLRFFNLNSGATVTESQVELLLESSSLSSSGGLTGSLALFSFDYDLTAVSLPPGSAFGSMGANFAASPSSTVPEPASILLIGTGFICIILLGLRSRLT